MRSGDKPRAGLKNKVFTNFKSEFSNTKIQWTQKTRR